MNEIFPLDIEKELKQIPIRKGYNESSAYIEMRDGIKIAAQIVLPDKISDAEKFPTALNQTRYWRAIDFRPPFKWLMKSVANPLECKIFLKHGYAVVFTDVRGTGASMGTRPYPVSEEEIKDGKEVIDWIIKQPWSDGNVIAFGNSYSGMTSELICSNNHPALKASVPRHDPWDLYTDVFAPGGCYDEGFIGYWSRLGQEQDKTKGKALKVFLPINKDFAIGGLLAAKGVKPVMGNDSLPLLEMLKEAAKQHASNWYPANYADKVEFKDDIATEEGQIIDDISIFNYQEQIEKSKIPLYCWASWQDSSTADVAIKRFLNYKNPQTVVIGDWNHIATKRANPFHSTTSKITPNKKDQVKHWIKFCNDCIDNKIPSENVLYYYTMGENKWKATKTWPPNGQKKQKWYFGENNSLSPTMLTSEDGTDDYVVDYNVTTGFRNRWYTLLSLPIKYPNRFKADKRLLTYTSMPLEESIEITGYPVITIYLSSTHEDGAIFAYLELISERNDVRYITGGQLRLIHRKISKETPPYKMVIPYHSFKKKDALPLVPGEPAEITFAMMPISILIPKEYRFRVAIAGADKNNFKRYPSEGTPTITVMRNKKNASFIELPIITK